MFNDAIVYDRYGPPAAVLTLKRLPLAPLAGGRVRVRMRFAPVNPSDLIPVTGAYRHRTRLPAVAGYEGLGEVVAAPYGSRLAAGQRVLPLRGGGTWQRFLDLDETWLVPVPPAEGDLVAGQFARAIPEGDEEAGSGFYTVRSVSLPVYRRLRRDNHSHSVCLQQALLHLLAWKSESPWARQQAQRLLWQGGVLGEKGEFALLTLDDELRERQIVWPGLRSLLAVTGFLVRFPAGPVFSD